MSCHMGRRFSVAGVELHLAHPPGARSGAALHTQHIVPLAGRPPLPPPNLAARLKPWREVLGLIKPLFVFGFPPLPRPNLFK